MTMPKRGNAQGAANNAGAGNNAGAANNQGTQGVQGGQPIVTQYNAVSNNVLPTGYQQGYVPQQPAQQQPQPVQVVAQVVQHEPAEHKSFSR